ncbi:unnamed protein product [Schistocephalus solidus]|uniref:Uncharacterized protein n=1 Tax=Schistocephalus solidus TaxID=70667 RepID=A0A183TKD3_SCHSO|nr:unnamed protein product [Schistocephalus solidus]
MKNAKGRLAMCQEAPQEFEFTYQYCPSREHSNVDALPHRPAESTPIECNTDAQEIAAITVSKPTQHHWAIVQSTETDNTILYGDQLHVHDTGPWTPIYVDPPKLNAYYATSGAAC